MSRALIVCGTSGVGKSSVAAEISRVLAAAGVPTAFIDVDTVAQFGAAPWRQRQGVSFYDSLKCKNVGSLWLNFHEAGALHLVVAAHVDTRQLRAQYEKALHGCSVRVALLIAPPGLLKDRLSSRRREGFHPRTYANDGAIRQEVLEGVPAEQTRLRTAGVHDFWVVNDASQAQTAARVLEHAGWLRDECREQ